MDNRQIRQLVELAVEQDLAELELEQHGVRIRIRRKEQVQHGSPAAQFSPAAMAPGAPLPASATEAAPAEGGPGVPAGSHVIRSPMVGTFYAAPEPGADNFVQVGDRVEEGQTLCIVEAMKLMNEITADVAGEVVAVLVENGKPVEYGQDLFAIRTG